MCVCVTSKTNMTIGSVSSAAGLGVRSNETPSLSVGLFIYLEII